MKVFRWFFLGAILAAAPDFGVAQNHGDRPEGGVWIMVNNLPGANEEVGKDLLTYFNLRKGPPARVCHPVQLFHLLDPSKIRSDSVLVLTDCGALPVEIAGQVHRFIERGGGVIALGGTLFRNPVRARNGINPDYADLEWITPESLQAEIADAPLNRRLFEFDESKASGWSRNTNAPTHPTEYRFAPDERFGKVLHARISNHIGWDAWVSPELSKTPDGSKEALSFWAKGGANTTRVSVEVTERDGSRWFATVPLESEWRRYLLGEGDFEFWESVPARQATTLRLESAARISFGLALTHTGGLTGDHEFWAAEVGTAPLEARMAVDWSVDFPPMDMLHPAHMVYDCSDVARIRTCPEQALMPEYDNLDLPERVQAFHPRPRGLGLNGSRKHRWIPLLEALSPEEDFRGTVAALRLGADRRPIYAGFAVEDPEFYRQEAMLEIVRLLVVRMIFGEFLWEAGATRSTYFPDEPIRFGARVLSPDSAQGESFVRVAISDRETGRVVRLRDFSKGRSEVESSTPEEVQLPPGVEHRVTATLIQDAPFNSRERPIDRIEHSIKVWSPDPDLPWIEIENGGFRLEGRPWRPYGVNYMPSSGVALYDWAAFEFWLEPEAYDPKIIERDLAGIAGMGMNMVSVFLYHRSLESGNLVDFLSRCEKHRLRVNLSLRPGTPLEFPWEQVKEMIEVNRLADNPNVFAFDLAWEPNFRDREDRRKHLSEWNEWIRQNHGGAEAAVEAWGFSPDRIEDRIDVPPSEHWYESGDWNRMVADYSRFLQEFLGGKYREARRLVKSIAPRQHVSFRMQFTGDPTFLGPKMIPYEAEAFVDAVDLFEPEAYGRIGDWERVRPGLFTAAYLRALNPNLPVFWAEIGQSSWDVSLGRSSQDSMNRVARYYEDFHRMLIDSHADGVAFWWYPGGYRANERSDYGVLNPDGTDRPVTRVIREWGPRFRDLGERPDPDGWIELSREWAPGGIVGRYEKVREDFWSRVEAGERVGLRFGSDD